MMREPHFCHPDPADEPEPPPCIECGDLIPYDDERAEHDADADVWTCGECLGCVEDAEDDDDDE